MVPKKKILLGVTGSIAAYKAAFLCRLLIREGFEVKAAMTQSATDFVTPLTFSTLTGHDVFAEVTDGSAWNNHVELAMWADLMVIAPCTASTLSKMASGLSDNLLVATYLSAKCDVMVAPAMDLDMWKHPSTVANLARIRQYGNMVVPVGNGFLASGLSGEGRMAEPEDILQHINTYFTARETLLGKKVLITAGPTYEPLDPVRFIGNRSSGKMGFAIAKECLDRGAEVILVSGPVQLSLEHPKLTLIRVGTAQEMYENTSRHFAESNIVILSAAVADYRPETAEKQKIKKKDPDLQVKLVKTIDIAASLGTQKRADQIMVGFALETNDEIEHATQKLHKKNFDFIVLNSLNDAGAGFQHETNKITIIGREGQKSDYQLKSKTEVARDIVNYLENTI